MPTMRVMTYNMLHAPGDRLDALTQVIQDAQPDVVACQEVDDIDGLLALSQRLGMPPVVGRSNRPESPPEPEHLALLTRWPVTRMTVHPGDPEAMFRPVLEVWVEPPHAEPVGFFNVHFRAFAGPPGSGVKMREVEILLDVLARGAGQRCALGDFNAWAPGEGDQSSSWRSDLPEDHRVAVRGGIGRRMMEHGFVDTWRAAVRRDPSTEPPRTLRGASASRVDFIWADSTLAPFAVESRIIRTPVAEHASDHYPTLTVFDVPNRAASTP